MTATPYRRLGLMLLALVTAATLIVAGYLYFLAPDDAERAEDTVHLFAARMQRGAHYDALNMMMTNDGGFVPPLEGWVDEMEERLGTHGEKLRLNYTVTSVVNTGESAKHTRDIWNVTVAGDYCLRNATDGWECEVLDVSAYVTENTKLRQWGIIDYAEW